MEPEQPLVEAHCTECDATFRVRLGHSLLGVQIDHRVVRGCLGQIVVTVPHKILDEWTLISG